MLLPLPQERAKMSECWFVEVPEVWRYADTDKPNSKQFRLSEQAPNYFVIFALYKDSTRDQAKSDVIHKVDLVLIFFQPLRIGKDYLHISQSLP